MRENGLLCHYLFVHLPVDGPRYDRWIRLVLATLTVLHRTLYRLSRGRLGHHFPGGAPVIWLTIPGRKTGIARTTPLLAAQEDSGSWVVAGSAGGDSQEPSWALNARAAANNPEAECFVNYRDGRWSVRIEYLGDPDERAQAYQLLVGQWRFFRSYAARAGRTIPVFRLIEL